MKIIISMLCICMATTAISRETQLDQTVFYPAQVIKCYDGDTYTVIISTGWDMMLVNQRIRLAYVDTPELRGIEKEEGLVVRDYVRSLILGKTVYIRNIKDRRDSFGRWISEVYLVKGDPTSSLGIILLDMEYAKPYIK